MVSCNNKDKTGGSDNGGDSSSEGGGNSDSSDGSSSGGDSSGGSGSGGSSAGEVSSSGVTNYGSRTGSGVKSELTGNWYAGGGNNNFNITDGKLSMSSSTPTYEGQIPDSFNYPLNIVLTGINGGETNMAIFTFYSATNGTCYYYRFDSTSSSWTTSFIGDSHKLKD